MTASEMARRIGQFGESLNDLQPEIEQLMGGIVRDLKANAPTDTTRLRSSIRGEATSKTMTLYMNDYGFFQNYGVLPTTQIKPVEFGVGERPRQGLFYSFQKRKFGIPYNRGQGNYQGKEGGWFSIKQIKEEFGQQLGTEIIAKAF